MSNVSIRISSHWLHVATEHLNVLSVTKELYFQCYLIWINLNSHMSLVATILDSAGLFIVLGWSITWQEITTTSTTSVLFSNLSPNLSTKQK